MLGIQGWYYAEKCESVFSKCPPDRRELNDCIFLQDLYHSGAELELLIPDFHLF
jgi:hypothetical protein